MKALSAIASVIEVGDIFDVDVKLHFCRGEKGPKFVSVVGVANWFHKTLIVILNLT